MGTSKSHQGPFDSPQAKKPATQEIPPSGAPGIASGASSGGGSGDIGGGVAGGGIAMPQKPEKIVNQPPLAIWAAAKKAMTSVVSGKGSKASIQSAMRTYVRAKGGHKAAAKVSTSAQRATVTLGKFLADVKKEGVEQALKNYGLDSLVGKNAKAVFAEIIDALTPTGATNDEVAARNAIKDALMQLYEKCTLEEKGIENLKTMDAPMVAGCIETAISQYIYHRLLHELGDSIQRNASTAKEAVKLQRDIKAYVQSTIKLGLKRKNVLGIDWKGQEGKKFIQDNFEKAFKVFE